MKFSIFFVLIIIQSTSFGQHNFIGKSQKYITNLYDNDPEYTISTDTLHFEKILIKCRGVDLYPYYTYEIDLNTDRCISYGFVSKNREVFKTYIELLNFIGRIVETDSTNTNMTYIVTLPERKILYVIKQPFAKSNIITKQGLFYVLISEEKNKTNE